MGHFFRLRKLKKGEHLYKSGEIAMGSGFVVKGIFRVHYLIEDKENTRFWDVKTSLLVLFQVLLLKTKH